MPAPRSVVALLLGVSLLAGAGCDRLTALLPKTGEPPPPAAPTTPTASAAVPAPAPTIDTSLLLSDPPGFEPVGRGDGVTPAPIYVTVSLNINDFMRPEREDQAVRRFLDTTARLGIDPVEVSFTGEVLDALLRVDPGLADTVKQRKPTVNEHYRLLQFRRLQTTDRELFWTDPSTTAMDRSRPGQIVAIQRAFGVTPRDNGGTVGDLLRSVWTQGPKTRDLVAAGVAKVNKNDLILHPDRLVAAALPGARTDGHEHVEAYLTVFRMMQRVRAGQKVAANELSERLGDLVRWAHLAKLMGLDVQRVAGLAEFVDTQRLGGFMLAPSDIGPTPQEESAVRTRAATDPAGVAASMQAVFDGLCKATCSWQEPGVEVRDRLAALDPNTAWIARLSWHASNDFTEESWSKHIIGAGARTSGVLTPATTRPADEQARIIAAYDAVLASLRANPRVRFISFDNDTQWAAENSPEKGYPAVFGVSYASVPGSLDAAEIDRMARERGFETPKDAEGAQRGRGGPPPRGGGGAGGPPRPRAEGGERSGERSGGEVRQAPRNRDQQDGARLAPRQGQ